MNDENPFTLNFQNVHLARMLFPYTSADASQMASLAENAGAIPVVNLKNPRKGLYLSEHVVFKGARFSFAAYARNRFKDGADKPTGVKVCAKVTITDTEGSPKNDENTFSMEIELEDLIFFMDVLQGRSTRHEASVSTSKQFSITSQPGDNNPFFVEGSSNTPNLSFRCALSEYDRWEIEMIILTVLKVKFPHLSDLALLERFKGTGERASRRQEPTESEDHNWLCEENEPRATSAQKRAIYAVGVNSPFGKNMEVITFLQEHISQAKADKLIKDSKQQRYELFERAKEYLNNEH